MSEEPPGVIFILAAPSRRMLLQLRDEHGKMYPGSWCFPGGACEPDETYLRAVVREAREEFEAVLDPTTCRLLTSRLGGMNKVFICPVKSEEGLTLHEGAAMRWQSFEEIESLELGFQQADILPVLRRYMETFP